MRTNLPARALPASLDSAQNKRRRRQVPFLYPPKAFTRAKRLLRKKGVRTIGLPNYLTPAGSNPFILGLYRPFLLKPFGLHGRFDRAQTSHSA